MFETVYVDPRYSNVVKDCRNNYPICSEWAAKGDCEKNKGFMEKHCAPACRTCLTLDFEERCPFDGRAPGFLKAGDLNHLFERITTDPNFEKYTPVIHSHPGQGREHPWIITLDTFLTPEECDTLILLGYDQGFQPSKDVGERQLDGTYTSALSTRRTSTNAWCVDDCFHNNVTQQILRKIEHVTGIPDTYSEHLQVCHQEMDDERCKALTFGGTASVSHSACLFFI